MKAVCFNQTCAEDKFVVACKKEICVFFSFHPTINLYASIAQILDTEFYVRKKYCRYNLFQKQ